MEIGLFVPLANPVATPEYIRAVARRAEDGGFASIWVAEHVVLFDEYESAYPYSDDGRFPAGGEVGILEPFDALSFLAAQTSRIRLGTGICLVPQRNPVYTAKDVATVDWLSGGRLDFGVGIGWLEEEFDVCATPFEARARRTREYLEVMKRLWLDPVSEMKGEFYELPKCRLYPKPVQEPHPPIHFGGESDPALRRVADLGRGWYGYNLDPDATRERVERLSGLLAERGRSLDEVQVSVCPYLLPTGPDEVRRYRDAGVDQVIFILLAADTSQALSAIDELAESVVEPARSW